MKIRTYLLVSLCLLFASPYPLFATDYLQKCWDAQVKPLGTKYLELKYEEDRQDLGHSFSLWKESKYKGQGSVWCNATNYLQENTLTDADNNTYQSKIQMTDKELLLLDYNAKELSEISTDQFLKHIYGTARYAPAYLIHYFLQNKDKLAHEDGNDMVVYNMNIGWAVISLAINKENNLLQKTTILESEVEGFGTSIGDVATQISYQNYGVVQSAGLYYPKNIGITKINGRVRDDIKITGVSMADEAPQLLQRPDSYAIQPVVKSVPSVETEKYSEHIYLVNLKHDETYAMIVEYQDFLVVMEAPKSSENGELIISEARKIAPDKPIKYFIAGHFHPHYLGGVRAFVHKETTVLSIEDNKEYIEYMAQAQHTLLPDSLQVESKPLRFDVIDKESPRLISDGKYEMYVYFMGEQSAHTYDYLLFYFPEEKMLFQGDLVWISPTKKRTNANKRELGLYQFIKDKNLDVDVIIQSWPTGWDSVKTKIEFQELRDLVKLSQK